MLKPGGRAGPRGPIQRLERGTYMFEFDPGTEATQYKIGPISKLFGIPAETLRYYESSGILEPQKDASSGYRYYTPWEVNLLALCRIYRGFGFSLVDTQKMMHEDTVEQLFHRLVQRESELIETIGHYQHILHLLARWRSALANAERWVGRFSEEDSPELLFLHHRYGYELDLSDSVADLTPKWVNAMPAVSLGFEIMDHPLRKGNTAVEPEEEKYAETRWGLVIPLADIARSDLDLRLEYPVRYIPARKSLHTVLATGEKGTLLPDFRETVLKPIQDLGVQPYGPAMGLVLAHAQKDGRTIRYCDIWVPIK